MAPRAGWKGYLRLSLVSCAVALYPAASSSSRVSFNRLNRETGNRLKQQMVDGVSGDSVERSDQVRGYEVAKGQYIVVEDEDIEAVKLESTHTIEIAKFVPKAEIDVRFMDAPYYIAPDDKVAHEPFAVIRDAMRDEDVVGIGRVVISSRERIVMLEPWEKGILATVLRYGNEVREAAAYFEDIPDVSATKDMTDLAKVIIQRMSGHFDPSEFVDRYEDALVGMLKEKQAGHQIVASEAPRPRNVINLMDALRKSIEDESNKSGTVQVEEPKAKGRVASKERKKTPAVKAAPKRAKAAGR
jgi:DNA end-binding protein Ku